MSRRTLNTLTKLLSFLLAVTLSGLGATPAVGTPQPTPEPAAAPATPVLEDSAQPSGAASTPESADATPPEQSSSTVTGEPSSPATSEPAAPSAGEQQSDPPADPITTRLEPSAPESGYIGTQGVLTAVLQETDSGKPVPGVAVKVQRLGRTGDWRTVSDGLVTDENGAVRHTYLVYDGDNTFRAVSEATATHAAAISENVVVRGVRISSVLTLGGKQTVVDERRVRIDIRWRAADGRPITRRVRLYHKVKGTSTWRLTARPRVVDGYAAILVRPRVDTVWRAVGLGGTWYLRDGSPWHRIDNVPPIKPVALPSAAPKPSVALPAQRRAVGKGLNPVVRRISDRVWRSMVGRSWHRGCPVGRADLRLVRMNYWGFDGYRHRGEMVLHRTATSGAVGAFRDIYRGRYPVRAMYRVDRFGWSSRLQGADDYRSMAADNTSGFNCRQVVGRPGVMSPHSYGRSIDLNPWENPYVSAQGTYPNTWWLSRSHERVAWRSWSHPVVQALGSRGFAWGGAYRDLHHFQR